ALSACTRSAPRAVTPLRGGSLSRAGAALVEGLAAGPTSRDAPVRSPSHPDRAACRSRSHPDHPPPRRGLRQQLPGIHHAGGIELGLERAQRCDPLFAGLLAQPARVIAADSVVVGDRAAFRADRCARGFLGLVPLRDLLALALAGDEREV